MEATILTALSSMGVTGVGFIFLWVFMQKYFKQMDAITEQLRALNGEMRVVVSKIDNLQVTHDAQKEIDRHQNSKVESMNDTIGEIHKTLTEMAVKTQKVPFGKIAVTKGYLTREQAEEILRVQMELHLQ